MSAIAKSRFQSSANDAASANSTTTVGRVQRVFADHCEVTVQGVDNPQRAMLALGLTTPLIGQRACICKDVECDEWLIYALFPTSRRGLSLPGVAVSAPLMNFNQETRTLTLDATRLELKALDAIEISCGAARFRLTMQGAVQLTGETITSSAVGEHRIEGASIDLN